MSVRKPQTPTSRTAATQLFAGALLFLATAAFVFWQNTHLTVLWDLSYILENAIRISLGQIPYRDFPFPYPPLTFLVQAAIIKIFGRVVLYHYLYAALTAAFATVLTWRILLCLLAASRLPVRLSAFLLAVPLVFLGTSSIFPHPFYDSDCTLSILFCVWLLLHLESRNFPPLATFAGGILLAVPPFIKQNTGLAFLLSAVVCVAWLVLRKNSAPAPLLAGAATGFAFALALIHCTAGLNNYFHWTIQFAASRRLPGFATMLGVYRDSALLWSFAAFVVGLALLRLPLAATVSREWLRCLGCLLLSLPFLWAVAELFLQQDDADRVEALLHLWPVLLIASLGFALWQLPRARSITQLLPLILLAVIHGAFLSQQLWGSTYALWPLLMILFASILIALVPGEATTVAPANIPVPTPTTLPVITFAGVASVTLLIAGGFYALCHERLSYMVFALPANLAAGNILSLTMPYRVNLGKV